MTWTELSVKPLVAEQVTGISPVRPDWNSPTLSAGCIGNQLWQIGLTGTRDARQDDERFGPDGSNKRSHLPRLKVEPSSCDVASGAIHCGLEGAWSLNRSRGTT